MMKKRILNGLLCLVLAGGTLAGVFLLRSSPRIQIGDTSIAVLIADTPSLRERGLSGRSSLSEREGMLFVFKRPEKPGFWMKDMHFPIDIIWISSEWKIIDITHELAPESYPSAVYPNGDIQYVLEVKSGFAAQNGVALGQSVTLEK